MDVQEILLLLEKFQSSDLTQLKVQLSGDLFEASRGTEHLETSSSKLQEKPQKKYFEAPPQMASVQEEIPAEVQEEVLPEHCLEINAPLVGTFYAKPGEEEAPFVTVGDTVKKGQVLCILEAMKVMNEIKSPINGKVLKILVKDGEAVDYGKTILLLEEV